MLLNEARARKLMERDGVDAIVGTTPEHVLYLSGKAFRSTNWSTPTYAIAAPGLLNRRVLVIPSVRLAMLAQDPPDDVDVVAFGDFFMEDRPPDPGARSAPDVDLFRTLLATTQIHATAVDALEAVITDAGLDAARIAVDEMRMPARDFQDLEVKFPRAELRPGYGLMRRIRLVKTREEIDRLGRAAALVERAEAEVTAAVREGVSERELAAIYRAAIVADDGTPGGVTIGSGIRSALPVIETYPRRLATGDLVRYDFSCHKAGYHADTGRTVSVGPSSPAARQIYDALVAGWQHLVDALRPGVRARDLFEGTMDVVRASGIPHYRRQHVGHAIGLEAYDALLIAPNEVAELEADMVLNLEVPYYDLGIGGFQIEDTVVLTTDGPRFLTHQPREIVER